IDPCGNDIIVCEKQEFNLLKCIKECQEQNKRRQGNCEPYRPANDPTCKEGERQYCLTIAYKEIEARPTLALRQGLTNPTCTNAGCGCNGKGGGGCSCGSKSNGKGSGSCGCQTTTRANGKSSSLAGLSQTLPPGCEPTRIYESY